MRFTKLTAASLLIGLFGCEFFNDDEGIGDDDATAGDSSVDTDTDTGPPPPPDEGFRVFPKFMLQAVPAVVTIEVDQDPVPCSLDGAPEGGYVCDASSLASQVATIRVDRNGFDSAIRNPEIATNQIVELDVHLAVEGGATGSWSACTAAAGVESCELVCEAEMASCAATSCETMQPEWPLATVQTFDDLECLALVENQVAGCDETPSTPEPVAIRCCCAS